MKHEISQENKNRVRRNYNYLEHKYARGISNEGDKI